MPVFTSLSPVSAAVFAALNVPAVLAVAPGGVYDDVPQSAPFPFVLFEVSETFTGGLGTRPGVAAAYEVRLRLHAFSQYQGWKQAQGILAVCIEQLALAPAVTGFNSWAIFHDDTVLLADEIVNGVKCKELVQNSRLYVEAA